jgi:hypothetical protein
MLFLRNDTSSVGRNKRRADGCPSGAYRDRDHRTTSQFAVFNYHSQVACDHAKTYLDATECGVKEPSATILFRITTLYGKPKRWAMTGNDSEGLCMINVRVNMNLRFPLQFPQVIRSTRGIQRPSLLFRRNPAVGPSPLRLLCERLDYLYTPKSV